MDSIRKLLVAYDLKPDSRAALFAAVSLGARLRAEVDIVYVLRRRVREKQERRAGVEAALAKIVDAASGQGCVVTSQVVEAPSVVTGIAREADARKADLVVIGVPRRRGLSWPFGSLGDRLSRRGARSVLAVRGAQEPETALAETPADEAGSFREARVDEIRS